MDLSLEMEGLCYDKMWKLLCMEIEIELYTESLNVYCWRIVTLNVMNGLGIEMICRKRIVLNEILNGFNLNVESVQILMGCCMENWFMDLNMY